MEVNDPAVFSYFASAGRAPQSEIDLGRSALLENPIARLILESTSSFAMILNEQRQILSVNDDFCRAIGVSETDLVGVRPGEALGCIHVANSPGGCGTSEHCACCGTVLAILQSRSRRQRITDNCHLTYRREGRLQTMELRVTANPLALGERICTLLVLEDVSDSYRRAQLERCFLHDISNLLMVLQARIDHPELTDFTGQTREVTARLIDMVREQALLVAAERGRLTPRMQSVDIPEFLRGLHGMVDALGIDTHRALVLKPPSFCPGFRTDQGLLSRILMNMLKNAFEATTPGATVTMGCVVSPSKVTFSVENPGHIPRRIALRIFERSFSTKAGTGRGIGTYSMRLLGEEYLGGTIAFTSSEEEGTRFTIELPLQPDPLMAEPPTAASHGNIRPLP